MTFAHPSIIAPALLVAVLFWIAYRYGERRAARGALVFSSLPFLISAARPRRWPAAALAIAWVVAVLLVGLSLAGPKVRAAVPVAGGTVILCIDTSGSMAASDVQPTRAAAAVGALRAFIARTPAVTAIGIVAFAGGAAQLVAPTRDRDALVQGLQDLPAPSGATAIGDALAVARRMLPRTGRRVVVLVTDGENNAGTDPMMQARALGARGVRLYTVGIGTNSGALVPGTLQPVGIDESSLTAYARETGGAYSRTENAVQLRDALARLGGTTAFTPTAVDVSLPTALLGAAIMMLSFLWMKLI